MKELESLDAAFVIDTFLLLLIGIGPKIALVPFLEMTAGMPEATKRRVLRKMLTTAATVAVLLLILGGLLTRLLHFSPGALGVASGIILLIIAASMVLGQRRRRTAAVTPARTRIRCRSPSSRWPCLTCSTRPGSSSWSPLSAEASSVAVLGVAVGVLAVVLALDVRGVPLGRAGQQQAGREPDARDREGVRVPARRAGGPAGAQRTGGRRRYPPDWPLRSGGHLPLQGGQRFGDLAAHLRGEQPEQGPEPALDPDPLDHPDASPADRLERVVEEDLAQRHRAFGHPAPPGVHLRDGEGPAQVAALLGPAGDTGLERAVQPRDLLADIPVRPASDVGPHLPDRIRLGIADGKVRIRVPLESQEAKVSSLNGLVVFGRTENGNDRNAWILSSATESVSPSATAGTSQVPQGLAKLLLFGFLGGFILNLMPCVLPVISLKIFGFVRHAGDSLRAHFPQRPRIRRRNFRLVHWPRARFDRAEDGRARADVGGSIYQSLLCPRYERRRAGVRAQSIWCF